MTFLPLEETHSTPLGQQPTELEWFHARYEVHPKPGASLEEHLRLWSLRPPENAPFSYRCEADARAACERHHATGKWE